MILICVGIFIRFLFNHKRNITRKNQFLLWNWKYMLNCTRMSIVHQKKCFECDSGKTQFIHLIVCTAENKNGKY